MVYYILITVSPQLGKKSATLSKKSATLSKVIICEHVGLGRGVHKGATVQWPQLNQ